MPAVVDRGAGGVSPADSAGTEHRVGRAGAEVVLEAADLVPLGSGPGEDQLEVLQQVLAEVHEQDVARVVIGTADEIESPVVGGPAPQDQRAQPATVDRTAGGLVPL